ncbi:hypothetical protein [Mycobacterium marinum]|uniref:hypothetical protein n=1 Tax=Mycobacterium marinum TaxID=1781 RepID=UPI0023597871|nr:hypothetical protein [Mycobacterium marinum]MDC9006158.1 hypothetical protein [Mycobacterium marinum]
MTVAAFVLGIVATVLAVASITWQAMLLRGARPRLTPIVGLLTPDGLVTNDAGCDVRESLASAAEKLHSGPIFIGVKVVNGARTPCLVTGWAIRADPSGTSLVPVDPPIGGTEVPHEIPPGASAIFLTELHRAHRFAAATERVEDQPPRIALTVSAGGRTYATRPVAPTLFSLSAQTTP